MTGFASQRGAIGAQRRHALAELSVVGVLMAGRASTILEMEGQHFVFPSAEAHLVAIRARYGDVRSGEHEPGFIVLGDRKVRPVKVLDGMAFLTTILVGG